MNPDVLDDLRRVRFWRRFGLHAFSAVGATSVALELADVIFPNVVNGGGWRLALGVVGGSTAYGAVRAWPRPIEHTYDSPNTTVRIVKGDLFEHTSHLVIGMCDTFDTEVPHIISRNSIQGQFLDQVFHGDISELNSQLDKALSGIAPVDEVIKDGKALRYPIGTVAVLREHSRRYFCLAYSEMNEKNEARGSVDRIWKSLSRLWESVSAHGNGQPVAIPVIGGGQSRMSQVLPAQDSIRFIVLSFILASRNEKVCDELTIVVRPDDYHQLDRLELQAFLRSFG